MEKRKLHLSPYLVSREWIWTAYTRARGFNKVALFKNEKAEEKMEQQLLINYLKNKIDGYKKQDLKAGRELNENNYVDEISVWKG